MDAFYDEDKPFDEMVNVPIIGAVAAGTPILASQNVEDTITFPMHLIRSNNSFMLRVKGESMINAGILDGDLLIVTPQKVASNGDIVVAVIGDEATVKTFYREKDHIRLQPENDSMEPIRVTEVELAGKVTGLFRSIH
jgi:repressor LexA